MAEPESNVPSSDAQDRVVIRGFGLVTPLAHSAWETFSALLAGKTLASRAPLLPEDVAPVDLVRALGGVSVAQHAGSDPAVELAERAAREAMFQAGVSDGEPIAAIVGASKGAVATVVKAAGTLPLSGRGQGEGRASCRDATSIAQSGGDETYTPDPHLGPLPKREREEDAVALGPHGFLATRLRDRLNLSQITCTVAACASSLTALHQARLALLNQREHARVLVVTSEAALLPLFVHSYARLGVLPPLTRDGYRGLPLDAARSGFMLAELGAAVVLERVEAGSAPQPGELELLDTAVATDGYDIIRTAPNMPALHHLAAKLLRGRTIDLLHPHATGTAEHDEAELRVYEEHTAPCDVYASKGALGHGLGAAGLVSLVIACLCAKTGRRPPMPWLRQPVKSTLWIDAGAERRAYQTHAVFAAGFGGHAAGAVIQRR